MNDQNRIPKYNPGDLVVVGSNYPLAKYRNKVVEIVSPHKWLNEYFDGTYSIGTCFFIDESELSPAPMGSVPEVILDFKCETVDGKWIYKAWFYQSEIATFGQPSAFHESKYAIQGHGVFEGNIIQLKEFLNVFRSLFSSASGAVSPNQNHPYRKGLDNKESKTGN